MTSRPTAGALRLAWNNGDAPNHEVPLAVTSVMSVRRRPSRLGMMSAVAVAVAFALGLGTSPFLGASDAGATPRLGTAAVGQTARSEPSAALALAKSDASTQATVTPELAYDLAQANGKVEPLGGAAYYGSAFGTYLVAPIIALVSTPDHNGYWLIGADGSVYPFGEAKNEGGAGGEVRPDPVVAATTTPDGGGYWLAAPPRPRGGVSGGKHDRARAH